MADIEAYKAARGPAWNVVFGVLRDYRLTQTVDDLGNGYPLVDAMTPDGQSIDKGAMEMVDLADQITTALNVL